MKKFTFLILFLSALFFSACQEENSVVSPNIDDTQNRLNKEWNQSSTSTLNCTEPSLLRYTKTLTIDGSRGASINFVYQFADKSVVEATLFIERGSYYGYKTFSITFDAGAKTVNLNPHGSIFRIPLHLTLRYKYLNRMDPMFSFYAGNPSFYYLPDDGSAPVKVVYDRVTIEKNSGSLFVFNARLPHFSRFGFCR